MKQITPSTGQIRRGTVPGEKIYELTKRKDVKKIVDIGTWRGLGSTKCIYDGIIDSFKKGYEVLSFECNKLFHEEAKVNLGLIPPNFKLIHGAIFDYKDLYPIRDRLEGVPRSWIEEDISGMKNSKNYFDILPEIIDLLIIDGGEFSGEIEFNLLKDRSRIIFMDDTTSPKNEKNRKYVLNHPDEFEIMYDNTKERCLICKNLKI